MPSGMGPLLLRHVPAGIQHSYLSQGSLEEKYHARHLDLNVSGTLAAESVQSSDSKMMLTNSTSKGPATTQLSSRRAAVVVRASSSFPGK
jgi:hypothetical protein